MTTKKNVTVKITDLEIVGDISDEVLRQILVELVGDSILDVRLGPDTFIQNAKIEVEVES